MDENVVYFSIHFRQYKNGADENGFIDEINTGVHIVVLAHG